MAISPITYNSLFIHSPTVGHFGCFPFLDITNETAVNIPVQLFCLEQSFQIIWVYIPRRAIAGSYSKSVFSFVRNGQTVFQRGYTALHFPQQWKRIFFFCLLSSSWHCHLLDSNHSNGVQRCLIVALACSSIRTNGAEHLFLCLFAIHLSSLLRCDFRSLAHFSVILFISLLLNVKNSLHILNANPLSDLYFETIFFSICGLTFHSLISVLCRACFNYNKVQFINFFFHASFHWYCI